MDGKYRVSPAVLERLQELTALINGIGNSLDLSFVRRYRLGKPIAEKQVHFIEQAQGYEREAWELLNDIAHDNGTSMPVRGDGCSP